MSVQTEIDRISTAVQNAHLKVIEKGGTSAAPYLVANLPDAIDTIPEATEPKLQAKTATPSETAQTVKPDSGYDGLSQVSVGAISKTYVGSGVTKQAAKTITPSTSSQTAVAKNVYTTGAVTVAAIPSAYVKPTATKAATTYTPSTSNQTIAAGTYCSGAQTIKGDANLVAGNIKSGVSIFGVAGTMTAGEDVTAETNTYTSLLDDLEAAVDALPDAGGGGSVETCTVMFTGYDYPTAIAYMALDDSGKLTARYMTNSATGLTLADVVCNSVMTIWPSSQYAAPQSTDAIILGKMNLGYVLSIEAQSGGVATINLIIVGSGAD